MSDVAFNLFGFDVKWYSILILCAVILGYLLIVNESKRLKIRTDFMFNLFFWLIIFGIIGARLYYVVFNWSYYSKNLMEIFYVWHGGLAIHGGIIAGLIAVIIYCKKYEVNIYKILDIIVVPLILGQAIGRWGNFFNQEAFGSIVKYETLVNMKIIPEFVIKNMYINGNYHLPMFYFESLACVLGFLIMIIIRRRKYIKKGQVLSFYLIWYGIARYIIESFRTDSLMFFGLKAAQIVSIIMIVVGFYIFITRKQKSKLDQLYNSEEPEIKF